MDRVQTYDSISKKLADLSDTEAIALIDASNQFHTGIGGKSVLMRLDGLPVFVKRVPLTDLEGLPQNVETTKNVFGLPLFFHYRIGSPGLGAWREVEAHRMATSWVLSGEWPCFPLMYHWRILPTSSPQPMSAGELEDLEREVQRWGGSTEVRSRLEAIGRSSACVALFLEYVPLTLDDWLADRLGSSDKEADEAVLVVDETLRATNEFMLSRGLVHFDGHFDNVLTDGKTIFITDFGLALSSHFDLTEVELAFWHQHRSFDACNTAMSLVSRIISSATADGSFETRIQSCLDGQGATLSVKALDLLARDAEVAIEFRKFLVSLAECKSNEYPAKRFEWLLAHSE